MANLKVWWFPEWSLEKQKLENEIKKLISDNFEAFGYMNIETPLMERNTVLLAKSWEETSKQIFGVYGLAQGQDDLKDYSIRFDLTVPFARYFIDHENEISLPFKRFQIQKVYRWERSQKWRYKEFYQCDIDVIDNILDNNYEIEIITTIYQTLNNIFKYLNIDLKPIVHLNDKRFYTHLFRILDISDEKQNKLLGLFDDYHKLPKDKFDFILNNILEWKEKMIIHLIAPDIINNIEIIQDPDLKSFLYQMSYVVQNLQKNWVNVVFDPFIVRGLEYYSGTVFETFVEGHKNYGSISSGWRYDKLVGSIRKANNLKWNEYWGFGWSIWLSRILNIFDEDGFLEKKESLVDVVFFNLWNIWNELKNQLANQLRQNNVRTEIYYNNAKLDKQFKYADSKNAKIWVFIGEDEANTWNIKVKNLWEREEYTIPKQDLVVEIKKILWK